MAEAVMLCCESFRFDAENLLKGRGFTEAESEWVARKISNDFSTSKERKSALHWVIASKSYLYDADKIRNAVALASKYKIDPLSVKSPDEIIDRTKERVENDHVMTLEEITKSPLVLDYEDVEGDGNGHWCYLEIEDSKNGMMFVRKIVDSQLGKTTNPWCLISRDKDTGSMEVAWQYWLKYCGCMKRIGFHDGKIIAFSAANPFDDRNRDWVQYPDSAWIAMAKKRSTESAKFPESVEEWKSSGTDATYSNWLYDNHPDIEERIRELLDSSGWLPEFGDIPEDISCIDLEEDREWWDLDDEPHYSLEECDR